MEEDIKRIEHLIERCNQCKLNACITCGICWSEVQAIENLLTRYKEERDLRIHYENSLDNMERLYVDKDKIKEKIEELEGELTNEITRNDGFSEYREYAIDVLQELLE